MIKILLVNAFVSLLLTNSLYAQETDQIYIGPDVYGITHARNFEYICDITEKDGKGSQPAAKQKLWIDDNFNKTDTTTPPAQENIRVALSWQNMLTVFGAIGLKYEVVEFKLGRCLDTCYEITTAAGGHKIELTFAQNVYGRNKYDLTYHDSTSGEKFQSVCERNTLN